MSTDAISAAADVPAEPTDTPTPSTAPTGAQPKQNRQQRRRAERQAKKQEFKSWEKIADEPANKAWLQQAMQEWLTAECLAHGMEPPKMP